MVGPNIPPESSSPAASASSAAKSDNGAIDVATLKKEVIRRFRSGQLEIPLLPQIATRIMKLSSNPDASLSDFTDVIMQDQFITGQIIKIANSPVYGGLCQVTNLPRAIVQIGIRTIKDLILGISMGASIFRNPHFKEEMDQLWKHSMACAYIGQQIAIEKQTDSEHAFLCGLVHDIGKPFLIDVISELTKRNTPPVEVPREHVEMVMSQLHQAVGAILAKSWRFTDTVMQTIAHHHELSGLAGEARQMASIVVIADHFAHKLEIGFGKKEYDLDPVSAGAELGYSSEDLDAMFVKLSQQIPDFLESINI